jgi:hypothetical protein
VTAGPKPTVTYDGVTYKLRSAHTDVPDFGAMTRVAVLQWLVRHTYPRGTNHRRPRPNLAGVQVEVR